MDIIEPKAILKKMRKEAKMTQAEFATYFKIPKRTVEDWERGYCKPPEYVIRLLSYRLAAEGLITKDGDLYDEKQT